MHPDDFYIEQHDNARLGNFIQATPMIRELYETYQQKISVLFQTEYVKQCYINSPYIKIIDKPQGSLLYTTRNRSKNNTKDSIHIQQSVLGYVSDKQPFIDVYNNFSGTYGVFINGAGNESPAYLNMKLVDTSTQEIIKRYSKIPVIGLGSLNDQKRNIFPGVYGDIPLTLDILNGASWVITNATGFYHAAGALNKIQLALWKNCQRPRNENVNVHCIHSSYGNWKQDILNFLNMN